MPGKTSASSYSANADMPKPPPCSKARSGRWSPWPRLILATAYIKGKQANCSTGSLRRSGSSAAWIPAISVRQRQVSFLERQLKDEGADVLLREMLIPARRALGLLFTSRGQVERGIEEFRLALAESNRLVAIEPNNSTWRDVAAAVRLELASNLLSLGQRDEAAREISAACAAAAALRARDPKVASWRALQTNCLDRRSRLALASGGTDTWRWRWRNKRTPPPAPNATPIR